MFNENAQSSYVYMLYIRIYNVLMHIRCTYTQSSFQLCSPLQYEQSHRLIQTMVYIHTMVLLVNYYTLSTFKVKPPSSLGLLAKCTNKIEDINIHLEKICQKVNEKWK
ncbi:unnamed protein product [Owenia fusiformis]|uniref:Uncharacterized protein n=1 Tax=Owenia fusiformis TaxID=6347 RepID=A0A8J1XKA7_OWEFU|nr:unnamed protein product [Owenia fusiformis]